MYNDLKTLHNDLSERFNMDQDFELDNMDVNDHNSVAVELNQELVSNYIQLKSKEITSLVVKQITETERQRQDFIAKQKKQAITAIKTQGTTVERKEFESPPETSFVEFLTKFINFSKNLSLFMLDYTKLDRSIKLRLEQALNFMIKHLNDAYSSQRWIFKDTEGVKIFFGEYFNLLQEISDIFKTMKESSGVFCCSSANKKDLETKITLLEQKLFAFPVLFNLEARKVTIIKGEDLLRKDIELPPLNINQDQINNSVQSILGSNFPELTPLYKLKIEKIIEKVPQATERVVNVAAPAPRQSERSKPAPSKTETAKELFHGFTKSKDYIGALGLFTESEREGCPEASLYLGRMYLEGLGTRKNIEKAYLYFKKAHSAGLCEGTYQLARLIEKNSAELSGQRGDVRAALSLYEQAAERNHSEAITDLGFCFEKGLTGTVDLAKAESYYNRGVKLGNPRAMNNLASLLLAQSQREGNQNNHKRIFDLFDNAAKIGYSLALANLGVCYLKGIYVTQDFIAARQLFRESADHNDPDGIFYTAYFLLKESSLSSSDDNYYQAASLLRKALLINEHHSDALYYMGYLHENGLGVDQDYKTAFKFYAQAVEASNETDGKALYKLATMLYTGNGLNFTDKQKALSLYLKAANLGDSDAAYILGVLHEEGLDVETNTQLASEFYKRSAVQGNADAQVNLALMMMDQKTNQGHKRAQSLINPVLLQTSKTNGNDDTRDDLDQNSPEKMILDAARRGNSRAKQLINVDRNLDSSYSHIERLARGNSYKENKNELLLSNTLQQPFRLGKETSYPPMSILSGKSLLNNYIRV